MENKNQTIIEDFNSLYSFYAMNGVIGVIGKDKDGNNIKGNIQTNAIDKRIREIEEGLKNGTIQKLVEKEDVELVDTQVEVNGELKLKDENNEQKEFFEKIKPLINRMNLPEEYIKLDEENYRYIIADYFIKKLNHSNKEVYIREVMGKATIKDVSSNQIILNIVKKESGKVDEDAELEFTMTDEIDNINNTNNSEENIVDDNDNANTDNNDMEGNNKNDNFEDVDINDNMNKEIEKENNDSNNIEDLAEGNNDEKEDEDDILDKNKDDILDEKEDKKEEVIEDEEDIKEKVIEREVVRPKGKPNVQYIEGESNPSNYIKINERGEVVLGRKSNGLREVKTDGSDKEYVLMARGNKKKDFLKLDKNAKKGIFGLNKSVMKQLEDAIKKHYKWSEIINIGLIGEEIIINKHTFNTSAITKNQALHNIFEFERLKLFKNMQGLGIDMDFFEQYASEMVIPMNDLERVLGSMFANYKKLKVINIVSGNGKTYKYNRANYLTKLIQEKEENNEEIRNEAEEQEVYNTVDKAMSKMSSGNKGYTTLEDVKKSFGNVFGKKRKGIFKVFGKIGDIATALGRTVKYALNI